ncbi:MAG: hypothetical protein COA88_09630 [Kordia sp.]|nr:MAG: hypothetical protein COA88_09630 [Kordia sp.]
MDKLVLILPILIAGIFGLVLYKKSNWNLNQYKILGHYFLLYAILFSVMAVIGFFNEKDISNNFVNFSSLVFYIIIITIPPTFYLYVTTLSDLKKFKTKVLQHYYLPGALLVINCFSFFFLTIHTDETDYTIELVSNIMTYTNVISLLFIFPLQNVFYIFKTIQIYKNHTSEINKVFSYETDIDLKWMLHYIIGYIIFIACLYLTQVSSEEVIHTGSRLFLSVYLLYIGVKGVKQKKVIFYDTDKETQKENLEDNTPESESALKKKIAVALEENELFLDPKLTIHKLASKVNSNSKYVSNTINNEFNQNFASLINRYRVDKAKQLLTDDTYANYTIESISEEVGFNSKTAFNKAFKLLNEITPSEYKLKEKTNKSS